MRRLTKRTTSTRTVDFVIAGTQKGGTTALRQYLAGHPEVCMTSREEGHFFDRPESVLRPEPFERARYHRSFRPVGRERLLGDNTPIYMYWYDAPRRMWEYDPALKLVVLLRNPSERAYSQWNMERSRGHDRADFWTALQTERERCREALPHQHRIFSYTDRGLYTDQLRRLWHYFPREQTLIRKSEDLRDRPDATLDAITEFLGVEPFPPVTPLTAFEQTYPPMADRERQFLDELFAPEIARLEHLLGWDCSNWGADAGR